MHAASEFQLQLDHSASFDEYVAQALQIAHRVQANSPKREGDAPGPSGPDPKRPRPAAPDGKALTTRQQQAKLPPAEILKLYKRCPKCAWTPDDKGDHSKGHACDPANFQNRFTGIRKDVQDGKDPNRKNNAKPKSN